MNTVLYRELAARTIARKYSVDAGNVTWEDKHSTIIDKLLSLSGIDLVNVEYKDNILIITGNQFCLGENGFVLGYYKFTAKVYPNLVREFYLSINCHGQTALYNYCDYLTDTLSDWLYRRINVTEDCVKPVEYIG